MTKDKRTKTVKSLVKSGDIKNLSDVFDVLPVTIITKFLGTNYQRMSRYVANPALFRLEEIIKLAEYFEVDEMAMIKIIYNQVVINREKKKRGK